MPASVGTPVGTPVAAECLDFRRSHVRLCGRENELDILEVAYTKTTSLENPTATSVFIRGESGSGKSALVRQFRKVRIKSNDPDLARCIFCRGKFEQGGAVAQPFSTVLKACASMVTQLLNGPEDPDIWKIRLHAELSTQDVTIVQNMIPALWILLRNETQTVSSTALATQGVDQGVFLHTNDKDEQPIRREGHSKVFEYIVDPLDAEFSFDRLRFALRSFIRTVSRFAPLVMFLDDMQWAGEDSLMLIQTLVYDRMPGRRLLLLGAYRPVPDDHPLLLRVLREPVDDRLIGRAWQGYVSQPTFIHLENLDSSGTGELISSLLQLQDGHDATSLIRFVYEVTDGSPFFILQLLHLLETKHLIYFSKEASRWMWSNEDVLRESESIRLAGDVLTRKILSMPMLHQHVLSSAACLGVLQFSVPVLALVIGFSLNGIADDAEALEFDHFDQRSRDLEPILRDIVTAGFLEQIGSTEEFKFVHDRIREAAYSSFVCDEDRTLTHLTIGRRLVRTCQSDILQGAKGSFQMPSALEEEVMLHAVNQMNLGAILIARSDERQMVAEMNYAVAKMAISRSAYFPAAEFLRIGLDLLSVDDATNPSTEWHRCYPMMLKLSIDKAKVDFCCASWNSAVHHADAVLCHATSVYDKSQAYLTKILVFYQEGRVEANAFLLVALEELGISFPTEKFRGVATIVEALRVKKMLSEFSADDLLRLEDSDDRFANISSDFFSLLVLNTFYGNVDPKLLTLTILRVVQLSLTRGKFRFSCIGFVYYGLLLAHLGQYPEAYSYGKLGLQLAEADGQYAVLTTTAFHYFISHWQCPIHLSIDPLAKLIKHHSYNVHLTVYQDASFASGMRLDKMKTNILQNAEALVDNKFYMYYEVSVPLFQLVSILTRDRAPSCLLLTGDYMDECEYLEQAKSGRAKIHVYLLKLYLVCLFGDLGSESELFAEATKLQHINGPNSNFRLWNFLMGLASFALAKSCSNYRLRWHYKRKGRVMLRSMKNWERQGVGNASFLRLILQAEHDSLSCRQGRSSQYEIDCVLKLYDESVDVLANMSANYYFHMRALANERAAFVCLDHDRTAQASRYMMQARGLYAEWGAVAKVVQLNEKYSDLLR